MATNLMDLIEGYLTPDTMQKLSGLVGENAETTEKGLGAAVPAVLAGLLGMGSGGSGASQLFDLVTGSNAGGLLGNLASPQVLSSGQSLLGSIFGGKTNAVAETIATAVGLKPGTASSLLSLAAPLVLGVLGKEVSSKGLNAAALLSLLVSQKDLIARYAPAGLAKVLGLPSLAGAAGRAASEVSARVPAAPPASPMRWLLPLFALLALGFLYLLRGGGRVSTDVATQGRVADAFARISLPGGTSVQLRPGSFNYNLAKYLGDPNDASVPRIFVFEDLNFDSGTTRLTPESAKTVDDLVVILKAYPTSEVRLEGHTDSTGAADANKQLSLARADAVKDRLANGGIDAGRMGTAGWGQEKPVASNDSEDGRAKNRRTELVVTKK